MVNFGGLAQRKLSLGAVSLFTELHSKKHKHWNQRAITKHDETSSSFSYNVERRQNFLTQVSIIVSSVGRRHTIATSSLAVMRSCCWRSCLIVHLAQQIWTCLYQTVDGPLERSIQLWSDRHWCRWRFSLLDWCRFIQYLNNAIEKFVLLRFEGWFDGWPNWRIGQAENICVKHNIILSGWKYASAFKNLIDHLAIKGKKNLKDKDAKLAALTINVSLLLGPLQFVFKFLTRIVGH